MQKGIDGVRHSSRISPDFRAIAALGTCGLCVAAYNGPLGADIFWERREDGFTRRARHSCNCVSLAALCVDFDCEHGTLVLGKREYALGDAD